MNTRKIVAIVLASYLTPFSGFALSTTNVKTWGDVNNDGVVDVADIASVISVMAGETSTMTVLKADTNDDGVVDVADIATIISIMASPDMSKTLHMEGNALYASATGDTITTQWSQLEKQILTRLSPYGITKDDFSAAYKLSDKAYIPKTEGNPHTEPGKNWVDGIDLNDPDNWVLPRSETSSYGSIVFSPEADKLGVGFLPSEMLTMLSHCNEEGEFLDSLGNVTEYYRNRAFYPYVDYKVAARLCPTGHDGWPDIVVAFNVRIFQIMASMSRPSKMMNGSWYNRSGSSSYDIINANIDAYANGTYPHDVRRLFVNTQKCLDGQRWLATTDRQRAFDFNFDSISGKDRSMCQGIERAKLNELHGDLYFYTSNLEGDIEEGTPYWHDANHTLSCLDDRFYADRYLIKACYTQEPLNTVNGNNGKLGKYLFAYKYIETTKTYDMASGQMIAYIDNQDTRSVDMGTTTSAGIDADGRPNESVNVHFNWNSTFMRDLINRAGRYAADNSSTLDGYSRSTDNPFMAQVHLNLMEEAAMGANDGIPVILANPDFCIRPLRPISIEFITPYQISYVDAAVSGNSTTIRYAGIYYGKNDYSKGMFRNQPGSPYSRVFPQDWRNYTQVVNQANWILYYQGCKDGTNNAWNTDGKSCDTWNGDNVIPNIDHILTNYGGKEVLYESCASEVPIKMTHTYNDNGNIESTTFEYVSGGKTHEAFDIIIPMTVKYAWGDITTTGQWMQTSELPHTDEQYFHQSNMNYIRVHFNRTIEN